MASRPSAIRHPRPARFRLAAVREHALDAVGVLLAVLYAIPSLAYPFGRDQAIFYYIGREWLHGLVPFKDVFDVKPPAIYLLNSIGIVLFGARQMSIRILDLLGVVLAGWLVAMAVRREAPRKGGEF